jgi:hypothetical protein
MSKDTDQELSPEEVYDEMAIFEPYTAGELASHFEKSKRGMRNLLERLSASGKIRKKEPEPDRAIWIREAPTQECPDCGYRYEIKFLHPVFNAVQYCPQSGNLL